MNNSSQNSTAINLNGIITSQATLDRIRNISPYLQKMRKYFNIGSPNDILTGVDSDTEDEECSQEQLVERKRRANALQTIMRQFRLQSLPSIDSFNPKDYDN